MSKQNNDNLIYAAAGALWKAEKRPQRKVGALTRLISMIRELHKARKHMKGKYWYTREKKAEVYYDIYCRNCQPLHDAWTELWDTLWNFIVRFFSDLESLFIDIANYIIIAAYYTWSFILYIYDWIQDLLYWCEARKYALVRFFTAMTITIVAIVVFVSSITAYEYSCYGKVLGLAKSKQAVYNTIDVLGDKLAESSGANVSLNVERDIEFKRVRGFGLNIDHEDDILNTLTYMKDLQVDAYAIVVDGVEKVLLEDEETAYGVLQQIRDKFAGPKDGVEYTDIHYENDVQVQEKSVKLGDIWNADNAAKYLMTGAIKNVTHVLQEGESYTEIMEMYSVTEAQLQAANPDLDLLNLVQGQEISLSEPNPVIKLASTEIATYYSDIQFGVQYIDNASIYEGETEVKKPGIYGKNEVVATITRENGNETSRKIMSTTKVSSPVDEVQYRGTKPIPERIGTGTFMLPIRNYRITSRLGRRWGRQHEGIDCGAPVGTKIYAADGGIVTFAGWKGGYGYAVIIDHGGLYETVYAHCSKLLVAVDDKIYQGQNIALVGSTGNSTGPHLHFELHYNGKVENPENYIDF